MSHWNLKRAARLGYLAGRGLSVESVIADHVIAARSERAVRCAASRWGLALGIGSPFTILLPLEDRLALECATELRGMSTNALELAIVTSSNNEQGSCLRGRAVASSSTPRLRFLTLCLDTMPAVARLVVKPDAQASTLVSRPN
jgi:hypothetical protein